MSGLALVDVLMDGAADVHRWLHDEHLTALGFARVKTSEAQRLVMGPGSRHYAASHSFEVWQSDGWGRLVWFRMDSEIPHMSSIVACVAMAHRDAPLPLFVMNLNLKLKADTFNTIMGYRGPADRLAAFRDLPEDRAGAPKPALAKRNPPTFEGVRFMFWLQRAPIDWALDRARHCLARWFDALRAAGPSAPGTPPHRDERYAAEMVDLHSREGGGVYDAVFGPDWLATLFRDQVFG